MNAVKAYQQAIRNFSKAMDRGEFDAFSASHALAVAFGISKEIAIDAILDYRSK